MNTTPATDEFGWKIVAVCLEAYIILASLAMVVLCIVSDGPSNVGSLHHLKLAFLLSGAVISFLALMPTGIILISRRQRKWGRVVVAFAGYTFLFLLLCLPCLLKQKF
jgi:hypothetical protein